MIGRTISHDCFLEKIGAGGRVPVPPVQEAFRKEDWWAIEDLNL